MLQIALFKKKEKFFILATILLRIYSPTHVKAFEVESHILIFVGLAPFHNVLMVLSTPVEQLTLKGIFQMIHFRPLLECFISKYYSFRNRIHS